jgi:hypothetical protein
MRSSLEPRDSSLIEWRDGKSSMIVDRDVTPFTAAQRENVIDLRALPV